MAKHLSILVEFIFAMQEKLRNINENSYNNFMLKIGKFKHGSKDIIQLTDVCKVYELQT